MLEQYTARVDAAVGNRRHQSLRPPVQGRARQLLATGFRTPVDVASASAASLCEKVEHLHTKAARSLIRAAKVWGGERGEVGWFLFVECMFHRRVYACNLTSVGFEPMTLCLACWWVVSLDQSGQWIAAGLLVERHE